MAEDPNNTSSVKVNLFVAGMIQDTDSSFAPEGSWSYARNASKVTASGSLNTLSDESSNILCTLTTYDPIGAIHLYEDKWAIFSTDNTDSEIGVFDDSDCTYSPIKNDQGVNMDPDNCLGFNKQHLIIGIAKQNFDCTWQVYFADSNNPDRTVNIDKPQFVQTCTTINNCTTCTDTDQLDCDAILLASLVDSPCIKVNRSRSGGSLLNGSYFATIAYTINQQKVTDYFPMSNVQSLFEHQNVSGSLDITFFGLDTEQFDEFELVIVRTINQQVSAKKIGIYSTQTKEIFIDNINEALSTIPIELIPLQTPVYEKSEAIYSVGDYAIRVAPTTKFDFNYQPLANRIQAKWISVEYPSDYYRKGGNNTGYLRDEIYPFFIRWIYTTGDRSSSYHIPGRPPVASELLPNNTIDSISVGNELEFEVNNTALATAFPNTVLSDGGVIIAEGNMAYWQSTEIYPNDRPDVWNASFHPWSNIFPAVDLCGLPIRHHKMPDNLTHLSTNHINPGASKIRILGVKFNNIRPPRDNDGNLIPNIIGYEILRGSREGNKTVIAKGILNNMRGYTTSSGESGLYQNYPYNFRGSDPTLTDSESAGGFGPSAAIINASLDHLDDVKYDIVTFHSPDTQFKHPFLSTNELKLYGESVATILGEFKNVAHHPREKLLGDAGFILAAVVGLGEVALAIRGQRVHRRSGNYVNNIGYFADVKKQDPRSGGSISGAFTVGTGTITGTAQGGGGRDTYIEEAPYNDPTKATGIDAQGIVNGINGVVGPVDKSGYFLLGPTGLFSAIVASGFTGDPADNAYGTAMQAYVATPGVSSGALTIDYTDSPYARIPSEIRLFGGIIIASHYWSLGTDTALRLIEAIIPFEKYAFQYESHGLYNNIIPGPVVAGNRRFQIETEQYLDSNRQSLTSGGLPYEINNLFRPQAVVLSLKRILPNYTSTDNSLTTIKNSLPGKPYLPFVTQSSSYYGALIQRFRNQYGQLDSIQQLPVSCKFTIDPLITDQFTSEIFGGDTYVTRYTEKNTFFYFYDWLMDQPDGFEFDYRTRYMITYPRFWADFTKYEASEFINNLFSFPGILDPFAGFPSSKAALDDPLGGGIIGALALSGIQFRVKPGYFYIFQSGVRDFYVESEVNTDLRDWGDVPEERHYDPYKYTNLTSLFDPKIIKSGNFYKYDYSLSISRLFFNFTSWGNLQTRDYDPLVAETCYVYRPKRLIYSLPQNLENKKDYWKVFLANNYKDFYSKVSVIKPTAKNGAIILFQSDSPLLFQGVDQLQTDLGTKITLGDGGLFSQPQQSVVNVDISHEYGSCQDRLSVINTPFGLYYMCTNQGKIFRVTNTLDDITYHGLKFWFKEYLPFRLLEDFPTFDILDNPVAGIGCQAIYDNQIETIYFCKRDFKLHDKYIGLVTYSGNGIFSYNSPNGVLTVSLGDPVYFQDASWTVSYDPKVEKGGWISYHDWHPGLNLPSRSNFLTILDNGIWRHNQANDSYCNYYGTQYPFALEFIYSTQTNVNTLRSIEYYLECYKYAQDRLDRYNLLDYNFDHAIIHNLDQVSGVLNLKITPKNDPWGSLLYPKLNLVPEWEILYSKEEGKYRFNSWWDITDDRGEFSQAQRMIWITQSNGYIRTLNPLNLNYSKEQLQRKKFRGYLAKIYLEKKNPGNILMTMKTSVEKLQLSMR